MWTLNAGKVTSTAAIIYDVHLQIQDADVTCNPSEFSVLSVYKDPKVYTSSESKAKVESLDTALKKAELYVFAGDYYFHDWYDSKQVDMTTATAKDGAVVEQSGFVSLALSSANTTLVGATMAAAAFLLV